MQTVQDVVRVIFQSSMLLVTQNCEQQPGAIAVRVHEEESSTPTASSVDGEAEQSALGLDAYRMTCAHTYKHRSDQTETAAVAAVAAVANAQSAPDSIDLTITMLEYT
jgi:hypothetical protein